MAQGKTETTLWHNDMQFPLQLSDAIQMLYAIEVYASACYDNTQRHKMVVNNELHTLDDFAAYEYTAGYPEKLRF